MTKKALHAQIEDAYHLPHASISLIATSFISIATAPFTEGSAVTLCVGIEGEISHRENGM
jgi:hypothetical protein